MHSIFILHQALHNQPPLPKKILLAKELKEGLCSHITYHIDCSPGGILSQLPIHSDHSIEWMNGEESRVILQVVDNRVLWTSHVAVCGSDL